MSNIRDYKDYTNTQNNEEKDKKQQIPSVFYRCINCAEVIDLKLKDSVQCKKCGGRILNKMRNKNIPTMYLAR